MISDILSNSLDARPVHFVGIAGAGMSGLAELLARRGMKVTGCDASPAAVAKDLEALGIEVFQGHSEAHVFGARAVIFTSAMPREHPELLAAKAAGLPVIRRAEALGAAVSCGDVVGISGTHGKTTTTVMTTLALRAAGLEPTGIAGGRLGAWGGNMTFGSDRLFVVEADEYDRSFLALNPGVAVVTNVEADHLDIYADLADIRATFSQYVAGARAIVLCADDAGANSLSLPPTAELIRYGVDSPDARLVARAVVATREGSDFTVWYDGIEDTRVRLNVPGAHNVKNALAAIGVGLALGVRTEAVTPGLEAFSGVERRFERIAEVGGIAIVDDYSHHPTEINAMIEAARASYPGRRLLVAFQPHLYTRTRDFATEFGQALSQADAVFLTELYPAREKPIEGVSATLIERAISDASGGMIWRGPRSDLAAALSERARAGDVVVTVGAGDITLAARELRDILRAREAAGAA
ncbi:MAG: UDP-N-acetylmuramate--L-alanine ligase [Gemmatimonadota bacterium]|nr:UDP-N-acetylmuramate--L-alanine ligase [Gemmatimonadota bacterium]